MDITVSRINYTSHKRTKLYLPVFTCFTTQMKPKYHFSTRQVYITFVCRNFVSSSNDQPHYLLPSCAGSEEVMERHTIQTDHCSLKFQELPPQQHNTTNRFHVARHLLRMSKQTRKSVRATHKQICGSYRDN